MKMNLRFYLAVWIAAVLIHPTPIWAAPYTPKSLNEVVEVLPNPPGFSETRSLQKAYEKDPQNDQTAYKLIDDYLNLGRQEGDPRYYGYAEALVKPLIEKQMPDPNVELYVAEARILQYRHDYDGALVLLNKVLKESPTHPTAHLLRATILMVRGQYDDARLDCRAVLSPAYGNFMGLTCVSLTDSMTGRLKPTFIKLSDFYNNFQRSASIDESGWTLNALGEMADRLGRDDVAEANFRKALLVNGKDYYAKAALADLLLRQRRPDEVLALLLDDTRQDNLLLRLALAEHQKAGGADAPYAAMMKARIAASEQRHETTHLAEYARFALDVENDPTTAFRMAKQNWGNQKDPPDARILIDSALAVNEKVIAKAVLSWQHEHNYEDISFDKYKAVL